MELIFKIIAVVLGLIGAYFIWKGDLEVVFVSLVLAACSALLVMRFRAKDRIALRRSQSGSDEDNRSL